LQPSTIQNVVFPEPPEPVHSLTLISTYIQSISAAVCTADGAQQKRIAKGKALQYDPRRDKRLTIFVTKNWPAWQEKYLALAKELFDGLTLDMNEVSKRGNKSEMKKAMPFVQTLKRRLESGEPKEAVLSRELGFDEVKVVLEVMPTLLAAISKLKEVIVVVVESANIGLRVDQGIEERIEGLPPVAISAQPGSPSYNFENI
jgi:leucyl-tRNA synthetase